MNGDERDDRLQDYLDDRMSPDERREFEVLLARDPDLAAAVEAARSLGETLRRLEAPLPDGFHRRARERFEATVAPRRRPSWEALGLAAAALVLGAILVPWAMRTGFGRPGQVPAERQVHEGAVQEAPAASGTAEPELERVAVDAASGPDRDVGPEEPATFAPAAAIPDGAVAKRSAAPPPEPGDTDAARAVPSDRFADAIENESVPGRADRAAGESFRESAATDAPRQKRSAARATGVAPVAAALTAAQLRDTEATSDEAGRVPDAGTWSRWVAAPGGEALGALAPDGDWSSIAVIAGPADCGRLRVVPDPPGRVVVFAPGGADDGCAIRLDDPAVAVRIVRDPAP